MIINHNLNAMNAHRNMGINVGNSGKAMEKLSSGLRINRAGDDAAGLAISEKMRGQIRGLDQASRNSQDGISMIQTAEGALNEAHSIVQRMRELAVQASNDTNVTVDRSNIGDEIKQLGLELERINKNIQFNEQNLLDGTAGTSGKVKIQVGANASQAMELDFTTDGIKLDSIVSALKYKASAVTTHGSATTFIKTVNDNLAKISKGRSQLGAYQNRLEHTIANLDNASENLQAAESRVRDVDMAKEMMNFSKNNILQQAAQAMLAQANQAPQGVLQLLR
ncbi:flagellin [Clostridium argentinense CDC 2741]|uniref:Flagellin n=1 Tax=Clostridium argentinense CDC 2741 TaxID=1418104 RepID=A0A0C1U5W0_9CLOT|nr:flagellin [Clostridium argentinense]KIE47148.1 flagellin [Clostridium argentinense CDC 2741]NFF41504.1 flagellin [Clostridium argentinense]NFP52544.1 flagellin [Clostridium argentinense]NFP73532.1 flagellin [Clostridium argentinense]NFP78465.1 flagellin [Clostridium argentinense]